MPRLVFLLLLCTLAAQGATIVPGGNVATTTWTLNQSPFLIQGDVTVPPGSTLTIQAGVEVQVSSFDSQGGGLDGSKVEFTINGLLLVAGTAENLVVFRAGSGSGPSVWYGIVANGSGEVVRCDYTDVRNAHFGVSVPAGLANLRRGSISSCDTGVNANGGVAALNAYRFYSNRVAVLSQAGVRENSSIVNSVITGSEIALDIRGGLSLYSSTLASNQTGLLLASGGIASLAETVISRCGTGVSVSDGLLNLQSCRVFGNGSGLVGGASSTLRLFSSVFHNNTNVALAMAGGGAVTNCTLHANGSAIQTTGSAEKSIVNSLVTSNGIGIVDSDEFSSVYLGSNIFWGNGTNEVGVPVNPLYSNIAGADAVLGTLDDSFALSPTSPAIDAGEGNLSGSSVDFRLAPRVVDSPDHPDTGSGPPPVIDIGAYEFQPALRFTSIDITEGMPSVSFNTYFGRSYRLEQTESKAMASWSLVTNLVGNGTVLSVPVPPSTNSQRIFRFRQLPL